MNKCEELQKELNNLESMRQNAATLATAEFDTKISEQNKKITDFYTELAVKHGMEFSEIIELVSEMSVMSMSLYIFKGIDLKFEVNNHVQWLECRSFDENGITNSSEFVRDHYNFAHKTCATDGSDSFSPMVETVRTLHTKMTQLYLTYFTEDGELK
jgi:hypothetical protein